MKPICLFAITLLFVSCSGEQTPHVEEPADTLAQTTPPDTSGLVMDYWFPSTWESLDSIQENWVKVERKASGYFIPYWCHEQNPTIRLQRSADSNVVIVWSNGDTSVFGFEKYTRVKPNDAFHFWAANESGKIVVDAEIADVDQKLVLWRIQLNDDKPFLWVMTPANCVSSFPEIAEPCSDTTSFRSEILSVEFESRFDVN